MSAMLYIAAKAPRAGLAKTRLARTIGDGAAIGLYRAFLRDLAARFSAGPRPFALGWYITPDDAWPELAPLVDLGDRSPHALGQGAGDWTERQRRLFRGAAERRERKLILIASDSPQITLDTIAEALRQLDRHDLVLGPTYDGGYSLIGMRGWHDVLHNIPMSTSSVCEQIIVRARQLAMTVALLEPTFDIDEAADLHRLRQLAATRTDLIATRAALLALDRGHAATSSLNSPGA
jgi:hypothetical protein